jgi:CelD/BcsL family acetyltransferase involved in cellulose biosynthesis
MDDQVKHAGLKVIRITAIEELEALQGPWTELVDRIPHSPIFLTWEWTTTWRAHYPEDGSLWVLVVYDQAGSVRGLVPWMLKQDRGPLGLRRLKFLFYRPPAHMDVLAHPEDMEAVLGAVLDYLMQHREEWDLLDLRGLAENSSLGVRLAACPGTYQEREGLTNLYISLPENWETFLESLSKNRRQQVGRYHRRLEKDFPGQVEYSRVTDPAQVAPALEALIEDNRKKWDGREGVSSFEDPRFRNFHRAMAALAFERDWLRIYKLKVNGQVISTRYCFFFRGVYIDYQLSYSMDWAKYRPGELMLAHVVKEALREGARELDFLPGTYRWKQSWASGARHERHVVFGQNLRSRSWQMSAAVMDRAMAASREIIPAGTRQRVNLFISQMRSRIGDAER